MSPLILIVYVHKSVIISLKQLLAPITALFDFVQQVQTFRYPFLTFTLTARLNLKALVALITVLNFPFSCIIDFVRPRV